MLTLDRILKVTKQQVAAEQICKICHGSKIELIYAGHGNILEVPCSICQEVKEKNAD